MKTRFWGYFGPDGGKFGRESPENRPFEGPESRTVLSEINDKRIAISTTDWGAMRFLE